MLMEESDEAYTVQISIQNASDTTLTLNVGVLTAGSWVLGRGNGIPIPDTPLPPGQSLTYYNTAANSFAPVGGSITFTPADGGSLVVAWERKQGAALIVNGSISSDTLTLQFNGINVGTLNPIAQYVITNIGS